MINQPVKHLTLRALDHHLKMASALGDDIQEHIVARGNLDILRRQSLAFSCSVRCPGNVILRTYDLARALRDAGVTVAGGFHSPMERECLALLLRGQQPIVVCPARDIERMRVPRDWRAPLAQGHMLVLSPFAADQPRVTAETAQRRNHFVAALAGEVFVAYAASGGRTERFCRDVLASGKPLLTLDCPENAGLVALGAIAISPDAIGPRYTQL